MEKKLYLKFFKGISYWNTDQGQGVLADGTRNDSRWGIDVDHMDGYLDIDGVADVQKAFVGYLNDKLYLKSELDASWLSIMDVGRISFAIVEDGEGHNVADEDNFDGQLYISDYDVLIELHEVTTPSKIDLMNLLPQAERSF